MRRVVLLTPVFFVSGCASASSTPAVAPASRVCPPAAADAASSDDGAQASAAKPLSSHEILWSKSGALVAANEETSCGPPGEENECQTQAWLRVVDVAVPDKEMKRADSYIFGFRADGDWLVFRPKGSQSLEEWAPRTNKTRPSEFAARAKDANQVCLSPDDDHLVVTVSERTRTVVRSRAGADEVALESLAYAPLPPRDCAFTPAGDAFALAGERHVAVYRRGQAVPEAWLPMTNAGRLSWSADGAQLTFDVRDAEANATVSFQWNPKQNRLSAHPTTGPAAFVAAKHPELIVRSECEWQRRAAADNKLLGRLGVAPESCENIHQHDVLLAPNGKVIAALEGEWNARKLVLQPVP
ncbi:MAG: hypothetical protein KIT84_43375 [Labilithrix sp.]|nr:hypothetical protein [Labilithrix sp.]MCW5817920.1 hypothetical protein [Labilithrix sp.]